MAKQGESKRGKKAGGKKSDKKAKPVAEPRSATKAKSPDKAKSPAKAEAVTKPATEQRASVIPEAVGLPDFMVSADVDEQPSDDGPVVAVAAVTPSRRYARGRRGEPMSREERALFGKAARQAVPHEAQGVLAISPLRPDPVEMLERQARLRVPELVPIRYGRMLVSPFTFYRGAAFLMAEDLASTPTAGLRVQLCGDAHLSNFGLFASPERNLVFDLNDFDETLPGPFEWDVKRLAASLVVAGRDNGFTAAESRGVVLAAVSRYRQAMLDFAGKSNLDVWYARLDAEGLVAEAATKLAPQGRKYAASVLAKARTRDSMQAASKLVRVVDGRSQFISDPPLISRVEELLSPDQAQDFLTALQGIIRSYGRTLQSDRRHLLDGYRMVDMARKVVGVGSVGTRAWIILMEGVDGGEPLILQAKEAQFSVLSDYAGASAYNNQGQRVVAGQHLMQASSDIFLGWQRTRGLDGVDRDFYVRQLRDWKMSLAPELMAPRGMALYASVCGWTLARGHARSGDRIAIAAYLGAGDGFDQAVADFAETYADQNEVDYAALKAAGESGRVQVVSGL